MKIAAFILFAMFASQVTAQNMRNLRTAQPSRVADNYYVNGTSKFWIVTVNNQTQVKEWLNNAWVDAPVQAIEHDTRLITLVDGRTIAFEKGQKIVVLKDGITQSFELDNSLRTEKK